MRLYLFLCNCFCLSITLESNVDAVPPTKATMKTPNERRLQPPSARPFPQPLPFPRPMLSTSPLSEGGGGQLKTERRDQKLLYFNKKFLNKKILLSSGTTHWDQTYLLKKSNHFTRYKFWIFSRRNRELLKRKGP